MNEYAPIARLILRYVAGFGAGFAWVADDKDMLMAACLLIGSLVEIAYGYAKKTGGAT